ncbi:MAG: hypothetical protein QG657_2029 [Acidobacteriota bacterium]|nr:hypothetical protein [Acidobacteriota bacterium]
MAFILIPLLLLAVHVYFFITVDNPAYTINTDPDYAYLLSAVDLSNLGISKMVLHPGTTFQVLAHLVMRTAYFLNPGAGENFQVSVLKNPVFYLTVLQGTFALLNIILVLALGIVTYRVTKRLYAGLLMQFTPFFSVQLLIFGFRKVTADILLISVSLVLTMVLVKWLHEEQESVGRPVGGPPSLTKRGIYKYAIFLGVISGFALATKVTFLVVLVVPIMMLPSIRSRFIYLASTVAGVFIFTLPIASQYPILYRFIAQIFTHKGIYGHGAPAVIDLGEYVSNLEKLAAENLPFLLLLIVGIIFLITIYIKYINGRSQNTGDSIFISLSARMLPAILISQILGILVVARHFKSKYLLPVLCLSPVLLYLPGLFKQKAGTDKTHPVFSRKWVNVAVSCFIVFSLGYTLYGLNQFHYIQSLRLKEAAAIKQKLTGEYKDHCIIYYYNAPSEIFGLEFGHQWTPAFRKALLEIYGDHYFYNHNARTFYSWKGGGISLEELKTQYHGRIILFGNPFPQLREKQNIRLPDFPLKDVFGGTYYTLYVVGI